MNYISARPVDNFKIPVVCNPLISVGSLELSSHSGMSFAYNELSLIVLGRRSYMELLTIGHWLGVAVGECDGHRQASVCRSSIWKWIMTHSAVQWTQFVCISGMQSKQTSHPSTYMLLLILLDYSIRRKSTIVAFWLWNRAICCSQSANCYIRG